MTGTLKEVRPVPTLIPTLIPTPTPTPNQVWPIYVGDEAMTTANLLDVTDKFTNEVICKVAIG